MYNTLKQNLDKHGVSQTELSKVANVATGTINKICNIRYTPAPKTKSKLVIGLNSLTGKEFLLEEIFPSA